MRRARLLHSPETVEVLSIDTQSGIATVRRQGFEQQLPLAQIVLEEEDTSPFSSLQEAPRSETHSLELRTHLSENKAELRIRHGGISSSFYALYIKTPDKRWTPLFYRTLAPGEIAILTLSLETYPPPWMLALQRLELPDNPIAALPVLHKEEYLVRLATFTRAGTQPLTTERTEEAPPSESTLQRPSVSLSAAGPEIDLHIEVLAPHLVGSSPEAIFAYQVSSMQRYLLACEAARQHRAIVIHGVGKKRLRAALLAFCKEQGWEATPLLTPPYLGGATEVRFI